ncbi:MAG: T9SS type A sorting domain-containing protein [Bacteroidetes bacterium]|nr:T9SS type A sorting domain-containing protein [Bacteroidota bacterium]
MRNTAPLTTEDAAILNTIEEVVLPDHYRYRDCPDSVDNSKYEWLRPIFYQDGMSCMQSSSIAYNFTYEINRLRGLPADTSDNQYPAHFAWNFFNGGNGWFGVNYLFTMDVLKHHGTPNVTDYGGFSYGGGERWMSGYDEWHNAMNNRISGIRKIYVGDTAGLFTLQHWLNDHLDGSETGGVASFIACSQWNMQYLPPESPNAGKMVIANFCPDPSHGMTIVGYNDWIRYDYNGDGEFTMDVDLNNDSILDMRDWEFGALKFVNSWGESWADSGFCYMMYKTLADEEIDGGIWTNTVHILDVKEEHETRMTYKVSLEHDYRMRIRVQAGISSDLESNQPEHIHSYTIFNYQGAWHYMQGNDTTPDHKIIEFGLDVTPLLSYVEAGQPCKFFLIVDEKDPKNLGHGQIKSFSLMDYQSGVQEIPCSEQNVPLVENGRTKLSVIHSPFFDDLSVTTEELPVYEPGQPIDVQLEASGGQQPYNWHFDKNYRMNNNTAEFPEIDEHLLIANSLVDSMVVQPLDFSFPFYGNNFDTVMISPSGYLFFDENMYFWSYLVDMAYFLKNMRVIAPFLCKDMNVNNYYDQGVWYEGDENGATFRWRSEFNEQAGQSDCNFAVKLYPDGNIDFYYGDILGFEDVQWIAGIADGDMVSYSLPLLPDHSMIPSGTRIEFISNQLPTSVFVSESGELNILEENEGLISDIKVVVTDNTLLSARKTFQLTDGLEIWLSVQGSEDNTITNGQFVNMDLLLHNRGTTALQDLELSISCDHPMIELIDFQQSIESIQAGESIALNAAFTCLCNNQIGDRQNIVLQMDVQSQDKNYQHSFYLKTTSPSLILSNFWIHDDDGILEPGESSILRIQLRNDGKRKSENTTTFLMPMNSGITVNTGQPMNLGTINPGDLITADFSIASDYSIPYGTNVSYLLNTIDESGVTKEFNFTHRVGKVPVCIVDMDPGTYSGPQVFELLQQMEVETEYSPVFPISLDKYQAIILCLGIQNSFHEITYSQAIALENYLDQGGNLYMEGRIVWQQVPHWTILDRFNIETINSPGLYEVLDGVVGTFTEGLSYKFVGIQPFCYYYLEPEPPAYSIFTGREYPNCAAVAFDAGTYKTIGTIFELGARASSDTCDLETFMQEVLDFFGVIQSTFGIDDIPAEENFPAMQNYPNPFSYHTSIPLVLDNKSVVEATVYDLQGRRIFDLLQSCVLEEGKYSLSWNALDNNGNRAPAGIYIYRIIINGRPYNGKMILMRIMLR